MKQSELGHLLRQARMSSFERTIVAECVRITRDIAMGKVISAGDMDVAIRDAFNGVSDLKRGMDEILVKAIADADAQRLIEEN